MRTEHGQRRPSLLRLVMRDLVLLCAALYVFFLFHQWLPFGGNEAAQTIVSLRASTATATPVPTSAAAVAPAAISTGPTATATPVPTPTPTPEPGDFSAAFPTGDTGLGAQYSYQSDDLKVAVRQVKENDVTYYVADVWVRTIEGFRTAFANGKYGRGNTQMPLQVAKDNNAILAVTGDYYSARNNGIVIRNGELYRKSLLEDVCVLYADGVMETTSKEDFDLEDAVGRKAWQAWSFGPALMKDGRAIATFADSIRGRNPRCAIGYYEPGHYCMVVVDGRKSGYSVGMKLSELSQLMASLGCQSAYNLDGGATAAMVFEGQVIDQPASGGRRSSDIIFFGEE